MPPIRLLTEKDTQVFLLPKPHFGSIDAHCSSPHCLVNICWYLMENTNVKLNQQKVAINNLEIVETSAHWDSRAHLCILFCH